MKYIIEQKNFILRPAKKSHDFGKIIAFDTEAKRFAIDKDTEEQILNNYTLYDGTSYLNGESYSELENHIHMLLKKYKAISIFAHNIKYDLQLSGLNKDILFHKKFIGLPVKQLIIDNLFYSKLGAKLNHKTYSIEFIDSMNYFRTSLDSLANAFGLKKYATKEDYSLMPENWNEYISENGRALCEEDVRILYIVLEKFFNMGFCYGITSAQTSFNTYRRDYLKGNITLPEKMVMPSILSYRGGIVNVFHYARNKLLYGYDINSLYPYVMSHERYSVKYNGELNYPDYAYMYDDIKNKAYNYLIYCDVRNANPNPVPITYNGKLIFFSNFNDQWITGREYARILDMGGEVRVHEAHEFVNEDLFSGFVKYYYEKKSKSSDYKRDFYKIILNSAYGKLAQRKAHSDIISLEEPEKLEKYYSPEEVDSLLNLLEHNIVGSSRIKFGDRTLSLYSGFLSIIEDSIPKNNPLIASEITANARLVNFDYREKLGFEHVYYTDTDSFFIDYELHDDLSIGEELGLLKNDKTGYFTLHGNKDYYYVPVNHASNPMMYWQFMSSQYDIENYKWTLKGVPKRSINDKIKIRDIDVLYENDFTLYRFSSLKEKGNYGKVIVKKINKELSRTNDKMIYDGDYGIQWENVGEYENKNRIQAVHET